MALSQYEKYKAKLLSETMDKIQDLLQRVDDELGDKESRLILSNILQDYDLETAANLVKAGCDPCIVKRCYEDKHFDEGNEEAGFVSLSEILSDMEEILNCDDSLSDIHFTKFLRLETDEEKEEEGHSPDVEWFTEDESRSIKDTYIGFEDIY